jgi:hypothetical protein
MSKVKARRHARRQKEKQTKTLTLFIVGGLFLLTAGILFTKNALQNRADPSLIEISGQPSLQVDQELIDYGDVKLNTNLTFRFSLTNVGDKPLKITGEPYVEVREGC